MDPKRLLEQIEGLPLFRRMEAEDFVRFLATRDVKPVPAPPLTFSWAGGLSDLRDQFTSRELKKKAIDWMSEHGA
jgi:hypothetical protein